MTMTFYRVILFWIGVGVSIIHAHSAEQGKKKPLFTLGHQAFYADEFIYLYTKNNPGPNNRFPHPSTESIDSYLQLVIQFKLKLLEALRLGLDTTAAFQSEFSQYKKTLRQPFSADTVHTHVLIDEACQRSQWDIHAAHILVRVSPHASAADTTKQFLKIKDIRQRALSGENFMSLAQVHSDDPSAQTNRGDLGYFSALQMIYPFESVAYKTPVGEISPIVRTSYGYHIIYIIDRRPSRGEVEISHILIYKKKTDNSKQRIDSLYTELQKGASWEDLCKRFSEDSLSRQAGGRLRPFRSGALSAVPHIEKAAFSLTQPGDISTPLETSYGWHLLKLEQKKPPLSCTHITPAFKERVLRSDRIKIHQQTLLENKKKRFEYISYPAVKKYIIDLSDSSLFVGRWTYPGQPARLKDRLFSLLNTPVSLGEFVNHVQRSAQGLPADGSVAGGVDGYMEHLYNQFVLEKINHLEDLQLAQKNPSYKYLMNEYKEGLLLFEIMDKKIWSKASSDTVGLQNYYQSHQEDFRVGERIEARVLEFKSSEDLDSIKAKIESNKPLTSADLSVFTSVSTFRAYLPQENTVLDRCPKVPGVYFPSEKGKSYLVEIRRLVPSGVLSFEEGFSKIVSGYQDELEKEWLASLEKKYPVKIHKKELLRVTKLLLNTTSSEKKN